VAEANAVTQNIARVAKNIGEDAIPSPLTEGSRNGKAIIAADIRICIETIHHLLLFIISTKGLQRGFTTQGRYNMLVKRASSPFGIPIFLNITTEMLFTTKYGMPSAK
jgi:hypothetical protein